MKKYQIIYADPPWGGSGKSRGRGVIKHYETMDTKDICALPIKTIAGNDSVLLLWAVLPMLPDALEVIKAWGFEYKTTAFVWVKTNKNTMGLFWGMGSYTRSNVELCLLATRGNSLPVLVHDIHSVVMSAVMEHSHKPAIVRERIVQLMGDLPRIELFARRKVEGWDCWGNEVESNIEL